MRKILVQLRNRLFGINRIEFLIERYEKVVGMKFEAIQRTENGLRGHGKVLE